MANKLYEENSIRDIANAIREKNGSSDTYTVAEMGDAVRSIESGGGVDTFWDIFQQNGERTNYLFGFAGEGWSDESLKIKYPIIIGTINSTAYEFSKMFYY